MKFSDNINKFAFMKKYTLILFYLVYSSFLYSQNAVDFTVDDCNGTVYNLYSDLDSGHTVVLCWVMPCGPCAVYADYAQSAVQSFSISHPGKVKYYIADDFANSDCSFLQGWLDSYQLYPDRIFSDASIDMNDYGGPGMPKVIVIGSDYQIYYNRKNNEIAENDIITGINQSLTNPVSNNTLYLSNEVSFSKDFYNNINIQNIPSSILGYNIFDITGKEVESRKFFFDSESKQINVDKLNPGIYLLNLFPNSFNNYQYIFIR